MKSSYDRYYIFYHVAKYKSFTRAAQILSSNQPNVTHSMNRLEEELGCRLFIRSHKGVALTQEGEKLYQRASIAFEQLTLAEDELGRATSLAEGNVTISASETALRGFLLHHLSDFRDRHPGIRIRILNDSTANAVNAVRSGKVDFGIVATPTGAGNTLMELPLCEFQDILIAGKRYEYLAKRKQRLEELQDIPMVCMVKETKTFEFYHQYYYENGLALEPDIEVATTDLVPLIVKNNLGIGFIPSFYVNDMTEKEEYVKIPLERQLPKRSICLVQDSGRSLTVAAKELKQFLISFRESCFSENGKGGRY